MEELWWVFDSQADAQQALQVIYGNMVAGINSSTLLDVTTEQVIPKADLTLSEMAEYSPDNRRFPVFGFNLGTGAKDTSQGYTTAWDVERLTLQGQYVFQAPPDNLSQGATGYTVEPFNPAWFS